MIEDEDSIRRVLKTHLEPHGFTLFEALTAAAGLKLMTDVRPQLVILDLGLPDRPGAEVLREIRTWSKVPVIVLTATDEEAMKVSLLEAGADDYIAKPFGPLELIARINVALRHHRSDQPDEPIFTSGELTVDLAGKTVTRSGKQIKLTVTEFALLSSLAKRPGQIVSQEELLREIWGQVGAENPHYLRIYIGQLRKKIEVDTSLPRHILTEPGVGYRLV